MITVSGSMRTARSSITARLAQRFHVSERRFNGGFVFRSRRGSR